MASNPVNAKIDLIHKFFGKRLALSILSGPIRLDKYRIWTVFFRTRSALFGRNFGEVAATLSSGVLRDFAVDPAATTRQATLLFCR